MAATTLVDDLKALSEKLSGVKPGIKTTEFVVAAVFGLVNLLVSLGVLHTGIPSADRPEIQAAAAGAVALISVGYSVARGIAKKQPFNLLQDLASLQSAIGRGDPEATKMYKALLPSLAGDVGVSPTRLATLENDVKVLATYAKEHLGAIEAVVHSAKQPAVPDVPVPVEPVPPALPPLTGDGNQDESGPAGNWPTDPVVAPDPTPVTATVSASPVTATTS